MNAREAGKLLAVCASYDKRTTGAADALAWAKALDDLSYDDCELAVVQHYHETDDFIGSATVRQRVKAIRVARIEATPLPDCPPEIANDGRRAVEWRRAQLRAIADGPAARRQLPGSRRAIEAGGAQ